VDGVPVRLGELWAERPLVLVHLRHFGCILCRRFAEDLREAWPRFGAAGVQLVAVGTGGMHYAAEFVASREIPFPVLVDKHLVSHDVIGVRSGHPLGLLRPAVLLAGAQAVAAGHKQGRTGPHPFVFGAAHVIARGGTLRYAWLNGDYQDNPSIPRLLETAVGVGSP
jgi:peroxiredoxin